MENRFTSIKRSIGDLLGQLGFFNCMKMVLVIIQKKDINNLI